MSTSLYRNLKDWLTKYQTEQISRKEFREFRKEINNHSDEELFPVLLDSWNSWDNNGSLSSEDAQSLLVRIRQEMNSRVVRRASNSRTAELIKESGAGTILEWMSRMPGIKVTDYSISYRGTGALFVVDGQLEEPVAMQGSASGFPLTGMVRSSRNVSRGAASGLGGIARPDGLGGFTQFTLAQQVMCLSYPLEMVSRIDLIDSHDSALYIPWAKGAVVSITLKKGKEWEDAVALMPSVDVAIASPLGYQTPAEFYAPAYATEKARRSMVPDYRTTLYWNPSVEFDETGRANVEFYTSDAPADYDITIEGITQTGKIVCRRSTVTAD